MQRIDKTIIFVLLLFLQANCQTLLQVSAQQGDGIYSILRRFNLPITRQNIDWFKENNAKILNGQETLRAGTTYFLPVNQYKFNGQSIRTTLNKNDYAWAKQIELYNETLFKAGIRKQRFQDDLDLWVPHFLLNETEEAQVVSIATEAEETDGQTLTFSIFGKDYKTIERIDHSLSGYYFYLVAGHGGPDPGAIGKRGKDRLCEDEYAYDVMLRFARRLIEHGAIVYIIVRDNNDGIRDTQILQPDWDEVYYGGSRISSRTKTRLQKRADIINQYYQHNRSRAKGQYCIILHVDSRQNEERIDIFYYYQQHSATSKIFAGELYRTVRDKYASVQPGRGYKSRIETRNLFMLQHCKPPTVYIELGNIQNTRDQDRFIIANNRQAVANWLTLGVQKYLK